MAARRCAGCGINWPIAYQGSCAVCGQTTTYLTDADPITAREASSRKAHAAFERWLEAETPQSRTSRRARYARELAKQEARKRAQISQLEQHVQLEHPPTAER